jgi:hypothetical protein
MFNGFARRQSSGLHVRDSNGTVQLPKVGSKGFEQKHILYLYTALLTETRPKGTAPVEVVTYFLTTSSEHSL